MKKMNHLLFYIALFCLFPVSSTFATDVGGMIDVDTTWSLDDSPYTVTDTIEIAENITLTIEPGVEVNHADFRVLGVLHAVGGAYDKIVFNGFELYTDETAASLINLQYCIIKDCSDFDIKNALFILSNSVIIKAKEASGQITIEQPTSDCFIEQNSFIGSFICFNQPQGHTLRVRYNNFCNQKSTCSDPAGTPDIYFWRNSFLEAEVLPFVTCGQPLILSYNYWGTTDTDVIDERITDVTDDLTCLFPIVYIPILAAPHEDMPLLPDSDNDGENDCTDNCIFTANAQQTDTDSDGEGDKCDDDNDGDGINDDLDNCPLTVNSDQSDTDSDGIGNACDNCTDLSNADQTDIDSDGIGDACDNCTDVSNADQADIDSDGIGDACDNCTDVSNADQTDIDSDGTGDACDNCTDVSNADQADIDSDGTGDACTDSTPNIFDTDNNGDGGSSGGDTCFILNIMN